MRKVLFRTLGTLHGIAGLVMLAAAVYLMRAGHMAPVLSVQNEAIATGFSFLTLVCLVACGVASWFRPHIAVPLAWLAALAYVVPGVVIASASGVTLINAFYYSAFVRLLAAYTLSVFARLPSSSTALPQRTVPGNHPLPFTETLVTTMSKLGLTAEERNLAFRVASNKRGSFEHFAFYASVLGPDTAFAVYGLCNHDLVALGLAFFGLLAFMVWRISASSRSTTLYRSLLSKVAQFESSADG